VLDALRTEFEGDLDVSGPDLAGQFVRRGLVDEYQLMIHPVVLGAGTPFWPMLDGPLRLHLTGTRRFASGVMLLSFVPA
jgi:dihydrofolate reductase